MERLNCKVKAAQFYNTPVNETLELCSEHLTIAGNGEHSGTEYSDTEFSDNIHRLYIVEQSSFPSPW